MSYHKIAVSEKTLEVNISAEILAWIRSQQGCERAFIIGMKQSQEARNGVDDLVSNVPQGRHFLMQFKAPTPTPPGGNPHWFSLNGRQYANLARLAQRRPGAVFYVLPHMNRISDLRTASPKFLDKTWLLSVSDLINNGVLATSGHKVRSIPPSCTVRSAPVQVQFRSITEVLAGLFPQTMATGSGMAEQQLVPRSTNYGPATSNDVRNWLSELAEGDDQNPRSMGQLLRGFADLVVP